MWPSGINTRHDMPARAAYAAAEAEVFPVEAQTTARAPSSSALDIATVMPRSLNEPVGLAPSIFKKTLASRRAERFGASTRGVRPSIRLTTGVFALTGKNSL